MLVTPEAVPLQLELAGLGSRALAAGIDWIIQLVAGFLITLGLAAAFDAGDVSSGLAVAALVLLWFLMLFGYPVALETLWRGRTVGKAAYG